MHAANSASAWDSVFWFWVPASTGLPEEEPEPELLLELPDPELLEPPLEEEPPLLLLPPLLLAVPWLPLPPVGVPVLPPEPP
jgi:hypothetical protein